LEVDLEVVLSHKNLSMAVVEVILELMKPGRGFLWEWMGKEWILEYRPGRIRNDAGANFGGILVLMTIPLCVHHQICSGRA